MPWTCNAVQLRAVPHYERQLKQNRWEVGEDVLLRRKPVDHGNLNAWVCSLTVDLKTNV